MVTSQPKFEDALWLALGLVLLGVVAVVLRWLRTRVYEQRVFAKCRWLKIATKWIEDRIEYFFIGSLLFETLGVVSLIVWFLGVSHFLEGIVLGLGALGFGSFQLPRLLPPHVFVTPMVSSDQQTFTEADAVSKLELHCDEKYLLGLQVTNLGINPYPKLGCFISFGDYFTPEMSEGAYKDVDFAKKARLQRGNKCVYFVPEESDYPLTPANHRVFPVIVRTSYTPATGKIAVEVTTETRWKSTTKHVDISVVATKK